MDLADVLRAARKKRGLTQAQLAEDVGLSLRAYAAVETEGAIPRWPVMRRLIERLKLRVTDLPEE